MADTSMTVGDMAGSITSSFTNLTKLITAQSYLAGLGFSVGAIMKFKQHKDNPTQIPIGTPAALTAVAAALLFVPTVLSGGVTTPDVKSAAQSVGITTEKVESAAESAGVTKESAEAAAESAGAAPAQVSAAETELKAKLSG
jgi:hypothetical protein